MKLWKVIVRDLSPTDPIKETMARVIADHIITHLIGKLRYKRKKLMGDDKLGKVESIIVTTNNVISEIEDMLKSERTQDAQEYVKGLRDEWKDREKKGGGYVKRRS